ncbi:ABC transporter ATP-binding protein [Levilactobacillus spicheri]|uniref:ABC transporter domain-containing protein n=1 Tax=Levilactobacillus spicheri TaxID=216463 RepID=A0A0F3RUU9_9LACO|nr:ABC transporter ATP-binding protein [Levilactobacillus spicheri]KJW13685.1 hypothetical protein VC81_01970 [Levilactobacillus spicheri]
MKALRLNEIVSRRNLVLLMAGKFFLNSFNLFVSIMLQLGIGLALSRKIKSLWILLFVLVVASITYGCIYFSVSMIFTKIHQSTSQVVTENLVTTELENNESMNSFGKFINLVNIDSQNISDYFQFGIMPLIDFFVTIFFGLTYSFIISWKFGSFYLLFGTGMFFIANLFYKKSLKNRKQFQNEDDKQKSFFTEVYRNLPILRLFKPDKWIGQFNARLYRTKKVWFIKYNQASSSSMGLMSGGLYLLEILSLALGLWLVFLREINFGEMVGVWNAGIGSIFDPFFSLPITLNFIADQKSSIARVQKSLLQRGTVENTGWHDEKIDRIQLNDVCFKYDQNKAMIIDHLSTEIDPHKITFIIGKNGVGKSTLFKLLFGVVLPKKGNINILMKNKNYSSLEGIASYVPQTVELYHDSLRNNLTFGHSISDSEILNALKSSGAYSIVKQLSSGLNTVIESTESFSPGELRRLAIARALLAKRKLILLDEPFSDIDQKNQKDLMNIFRKMSNEMGLIIITHDFKWITEEDNILSLGGGSKYE